MSHLDQAYQLVARANYQAHDVLHARSLFRAAADELRAAKAYDLARYVEKELDHAIDSPVSESVLDAIDRRILGRAIKKGI